RLSISRPCFLQNVFNNWFKRKTLLNSVLHIDTNPFATINVRDFTTFVNKAKLNCMRTIPGVQYATITIELARNVETDMYWRNNSIKCNCCQIFPNHQQKLLSLVSAQYTLISSDLFNGAVSGITQRPFWPINCITYANAFP
ncbi:unnamed protein product, partial [Owenia fusiformis]